MKTNANFKAYLTNPTITRSDKVTMIDNAFDAKSNTSPVTKNLLVTMAGNARLGDAEKVFFFPHHDFHTTLVATKPFECRRLFRNFF